MSDITRILQSVESGNPTAADELLPLVYEELRKLAASKMANEQPNQTLQPTALVHEAWLRLTGNEKVKWNGRGHFFGAAAEAMRRILIDNARRKQAARRGAGAQRVDIDAVEIAAPAKDDELLAINEALDELATVDKSKAELVKLHYFVGLTMEDCANVLDISVPTARRWWTFSRAWLYQRVQNV
jgi:RNA polymerase sigma factor (TIGR02999 family)